MYNEQEQGNGKKINIQQATMERKTVQREVVN